MQKATLFMRVSDLDAATKSITFAVGAAVDSYAAAGGFEVVRKALTALTGETLTRMNAGQAAHRGPEVGEIVRVLADCATKRISVVARVSDAATWEKLQAGVYKGARVAVWGNGVNRAAGQLMLVDAPEFSDVMLRRDHGNLDRTSETLDAAAAALRLTRAALERVESRPAPAKTAGAYAVFTDQP